MKVIVSAKRVIMAEVTTSTQQVMIVKQVRLASAEAPSIIVCDEAKRVVFVLNS